MHITVLGVIIVGSVKLKKMAPNMQKMTLLKVIILHIYVVMTYIYIYIYYYNTHLSK